MKSSTGWISLFGLLAFTGCTESGTLRLDSQVAQSQSALTTMPSGSSLELAGGTLVLQRARIAVSEIELEGGSDDEREADLGSAVMDLELNGTPTVVAADSVEAGSYHTIGLELTTRDFGGAPASIIIEGTSMGTAFTYRSTWRPELEFRLDPQVVVPANGEATVGVSFDVGAWFTAADGSAINPADGRIRR